MREKDLEQSFFYKPFHVHEQDGANENEGCLMIVRNLWCYKHSAYTFDLR